VYAVLRTPKKGKEKKVDALRDAIEKRCGSEGAGDEPGHLSQGGSPCMEEGPLELCRRHEKGAPSRLLQRRG